MKKLQITHMLLLPMLCIMVLSGCTSNNGDIGDYFGEWRLEKLTADGQELPLYSGGSGVELYTWAFQDNLIQITSVLPHHEAAKCIGTWREEAGMLELTFSYTEDNKDNQGYYTPPAALHLVEGGVTGLHIDRFKDHRMILSRVSDDGVTYVYYLRKPV